MKINQLAILLGLTGTLLLGCSSDDDDNDQVVETPEPPPVEEPGPAPIELSVFDDDGKLDAQIRRTTFGVPHITADNLESLAFGSGYAQATDHLCIIADGVVKANSQRAQFFGPHTLDFATGLPVAEDNKNLVSDFGHLALRIRESAEAAVPEMPDRSRAMLSGFTKGYNQYLSELGGSSTPNLPCAGQSWVYPIDEVDLMTYLFSIAHMPGTGNFLDLMFFANPGDGEEYLPRPAAMAAVSAEDKQLLAGIDATARKQARELGIPTLNEGGAEVGSNGWGLGKNVTENGKGIVLGNPHFPHTGELRFWQSHLTIPGQLDVMGGSLVGMPGAINIGFNQNLAWTHTFSTAEHFVMYQLSLKDGDRMTYLFDGEEMPIEKRIATIQVNVGGGNTIPLEKEIYLTPKGPMVEAPPELAPFGWTDGVAFFVQDANEQNTDVLEHWLAMNLARDLDEFQQAFKDFDGVIFNNTMYADDQGNAFYIDDSTVPNLSETAKVALTSDRVLITLKEQAGFTLLPGNASVYAFDDAVPYEEAPKLLRDDFVQNSNNSFWSTNPAEPIEGISPLYGPQRGELTLRTRMGLTLMEDARGDDGLFNPTEVEAALMSNRAYLAELLLPELLAQCEVQGSTPVVLTPELSVDLTEACAALAQWNGAQNLDSPAGALLREFGYRFNSDMLAVPFDYTQPVTTPNTLLDDGRALEALAAAAASLTANGFALDAPLGEMQFIEKSLPDGTASGAKFPWAGANNKEGGFNVFAYSSRDTTLLPRHVYPKATDAVTGGAMGSGLSTEGYHVRSGSSWMMVVGFTEDGPVARGLLSYSESNNALSEHWNDQTQYYSENTALRPLLFNEDAIQAGLLSEQSLSLDTSEQ